jgi:hypothetical protein
VSGGRVWDGQCVYAVDVGSDGCLCMYGFLLA